MRLLKSLLLISSFFATVCYAEVNILLLGSQLKTSRLNQTQALCKNNDCRQAHNEALKNEAAVYNDLSKNANKSVPFTTWSTQDYAQKNKKSFEMHSRALKEINTTCEKNFKLLPSLSHLFTTEKFDEKFCEKIKTQFEKTTAITNEAIVKETDSSLAGCKLNYDQKEINCPFGVYVKSKSVADGIRGTKASETPVGSKIENKSKVESK